VLGLAKQGTYRDRVDEMRRKDAEPRPLTFWDAKREPREYDTSALRGMSFGSPLSDMMGIYEKAGTSEQIDYKYQLALLWQNKFARMVGDEPLEEYDTHHPGILDAIESIYAGYKSPEPLGGVSIETYRSSIDAVVDQLEGALDWGKVQRLFVLKKNQLDSMRRFAGEIDADLLLSYAMTELMPSEDGARNVTVFDFLLRNAGRGYIDRIPALGDRLLSFGPYQFTPAALPHTTDGSGRTVRSSAHLLDATLKSPVLPSNVVSLSGDDHHRAAYLFALYNIAVLVKDLGEERCAALAKRGRMSAAVRDYVVAAHHRPVEARKAFINVAFGAHGGNRVHTLADFCKPDVQTYIRKTRANNDALRRRYAAATKAR